MRPNAVAPPVAATTPIPDPERTIVPISAHDGRSSGESPIGAASTRFGNGDRFASQDRFVALEPGHLDQAKISRHQLPQLQTDDVAGHQVGDVDLDVGAVTSNRRAVPNPIVERLDRRVRIGVR